LLVNSNCELKICDFGLSRPVINDLSKKQNIFTEYIATRWYRAPEVLLSWYKYHKAVDMWSVGCIFGELLGRKALFKGDDSKHF
jgi:serine/threonine protein kinase